MYRAYARYVAVIAHRVMGTPEDAEDVVQDVFLDYQSSRGRIRDPRALKGWLATATVRIAKRRLWRKRFLRVIGFDDTDYHAAASGHATAEQRAEIAALYRHLDHVSVGRRTAWVLRRVQGAALAEVAELCGVSLATTKRWIADVDRHVGEVYRDE